MELDRIKSAWKNTPLQENPLLSSANLSGSVQLLRVKTVRDLQHSDELARAIFCFLFAMVLSGASLRVLIPGPGRVIALLFAVVLLIDAAGTLLLLIRRFRAPAACAMREFISREHRQLEIRFRLERYSQALMFLLALAAVLILMFGPRPANYRDRTLDALAIMAMITAFLAIAWRRAKSGANKLRLDLERWLKDLNA